MVKKKKDEEEYCDCVEWTSAYYDEAGEERCEECKKLVRLLPYRHDE